MAALFRFQKLILFRRSLLLVLEAGPAISCAAGGGWPRSWDRDLELSLGSRGRWRPGTAQRRDLGWPAVQL